MLCSDISATLPTSFCIHFYEIYPIVHPLVYPLVSFFHAQSAKKAIKSIAMNAMRLFSPLPAIFNIASSSLSLSDSRGRSLVVLIKCVQHGETQLAAAA